jgi:hypothetical protein
MNGRSSSDGVSLLLSSCPKSPGRTGRWWLIRRPARGPLVASFAGRRARKSSGGEVTHGYGGVAGIVVWTSLGPLDLVGARISGHVRTGNALTGSKRTDEVQRSPAPAEPAGGSGPGGQRINHQHHPQRWWLIRRVAACAAAPARRARAASGAGVTRGYGGVAGSMTFGPRCVLWASSCCACPDISGQEMTQRGPNRTMRPKDSSRKTSRTDETREERPPYANKPPKRRHAPVSRFWLPPGP